MFETTAVDVPHSVSSPNKLELATTFGVGSQEERLQWLGMYYKQAVDYFFPISTDPQAEDPHQYQLRNNLLTDYFSVDMKDESWLQAVIDLKAASQAIVEIITNTTSANPGEVSENYHNTMRQLIEELVPKYAPDEGKADQPNEITPAAAIITKFIENACYAYDIKTKGDAYTDVPPLTAEYVQEVQSWISTHPKATTAQKTLQTNLVIRFLHNQRHLDPATAKLWTQEYVRHIIECGTRDEKRDAYSNTKIDIARLTQTLTEAQEQGIIRPDSAMVALGVGEGIVELAALSTMDTTQLIGVDSNPITNNDSRLYKIIKPVELLFKSDFPESTSNKPVVYIAFGSPFNNEVSFTNFISTLFHVSDLMQPGDTLLLDIGVPDPMIAENYRYRRSVAMASQPFGILPVNPAYRDAEKGYTSDTPGAMTPSLLLMQAVIEAGNLHLKAPTITTFLNQMSKLDADPAELLKLRQQCQIEENLDPFHTPVVVVDEGGTNFRTIMVCQKQSVSAEPAISLIPALVTNPSSNVTNS